MNHATLVQIWSAVCPWLAIVWCLVRLARSLHVGLRALVLLAVTSAIGVAILLVPIQGLMIARWVAALNANFCVPLTALLAISIWERIFERPLLSDRGWSSAWAFGAVGGLLLYPMALGLGSLDPYEWGWTFSALFIIVGAVTVWMILRHNRFGFVLLVSAAAFQLRLLESTNYWDYLLDPIYSLVSIGWVVGRLASTRTSFTKRYSNTLPRNISTI